ncbi:hypothetical protein H1C71_018864, partial [Ictidomys tridecemlineatus]
GKPSSGFLRFAPVLPSALCSRPGLCSSSLLSLPAVPCPLLLPAATSAATACSPFCALPVCLATRHVHPSSLPGWLPLPPWQAEWVPPGWSHRTSSSPLLTSSTDKTLPPPPPPLSSSSPPTAMITSTHSPLSSPDPSYQITHSSFVL